MHFPALFTVLSAATVAAIPQHDTQGHPAPPAATNKITPHITQPEQQSAFFGLTADLVNKKCVGAYGNICNKPGADSPILGDYDPHTGKCVLSRGRSGPSQSDVFCENIIATLFYEDANYTINGQKPKAGEVFLKNSTITGPGPIPVGLRPGCWAGLTARVPEWFGHCDDYHPQGRFSATARNGIHSAAPQAGF